MKKLLTLSVLLFTVVFTYTTIAQEMGAIRKSVEYSFPEKIQKLVLEPLPAGTYSVGGSGDFPTIDSAFNKLSVDGIAGEVILELIDNFYQTTSDTFGFFLNGPILGAGTNSRVTIKPAANKNVTIEGNVYGVLYFLNTSYVTIDGIDLTGSTTLTVHSLLNTQFPWNDTFAFMNNSDHNIVQNVTFISEDVTRSGGGPAFYPEYPAGSLFAPDSNLIQNNFIKKGGIAIYVSAEFSAVKAIGNIIRGNIVGSETDSLISWGIQAQYTRNTIIENNIVHSIRRGNVWQTATPGINSYFGSGDIIRNNIVHSLRSDTGYTSVGILLSGSSNERGSNNQVYNNMIYDIQSTSTQTNSRVAGIQIWLQDNPKIYYNSVYLTGTGANHQGSAAFYIYGGFGASTGVDVKDNIFVNTRDESPYWASSIYDYSALNLTSDYNDLYYELNQYNALVRIGSTNYNTLADWQATGQDLNSVTEMPNFVDPYLHIDETIPTYLESGATPIAGISVDIDGDTRNAITPDIGADEFTIMPTPTLTVVSPNGGEVWIVDETEDITWISEYVTDVMIKLSIDNGTTWSSIVDATPSTGTYSWEVEAQDSSDQCLIKVTDISDSSINDESDAVFTIDIISSVNDNDEGIPTVYALEQNFPNPFNPSTTIIYSIPEVSKVRLTLFNLLGEEVATLVNEEKSAGNYIVEFNAANLPSGIYFYRIQAGSFIDTKKMILLK